MMLLHFRSPLMVFCGQVFCHSQWNICLHLPHRFPRSAGAQFGGQPWARGSSVPLWICSPGWLWSAVFGQLLWWRQLAVRTSGWRQHTSTDRDGDWRAAVWKSGKLKVHLQEKVEENTSVTGVISVSTPFCILQPRFVLMFQWYSLPELIEGKHSCFNDLPVGLVLWFVCMF